ncbi:MAG: feruloyl-CoA synthase [Rhodobacteraceae bacterium]|nr:feruloyl-CoA synthase [Paracoccaceae bacterium]
MHKISFAPPLVERQDLDDGSFILRSPVKLKPYANNICQWLENWASKTPNRIFLAERDETGNWAEYSYSQARSMARAVAQALMGRNITAERTVMIVSDNSVDHAIMYLGGIMAGIPVSQITPAYALMSQDHGKLKHVFNVLNPSLIYAPDGRIYEKALKALDLEGVEVVVSKNPPAELAATPFSSLLATTETPDVDVSVSALDPDGVAKILFTSGSTGLPKGVINTHRMMCSNQQALAQCWPFIENRPPVLVEWLPWSHTFGSNHNFNLALRNGGTMYIDAGKPAPGLVDTTVKNLKDVAPTIYFNVPRGYDQLIPFLESDDSFRDHFFSNLDTLFFAAAALPQNLFRRLQDLSLAARGSEIPMTTAWGSTETAPLTTSVHFAIDRSDLLGLPAPGSEVKLVPSGGKLEARIRGVNVTPGYYGRPDISRDAFDEDGFYRIGDAVKLANPDNPAEGLVFDGRIAEDFKLMTGSWVSASTIRTAAIAAANPMIQDAVVTGHDRDEIGLLVFANAPALAEVAGLPPESPVSELTRDPKVKAELIRKLDLYNKDHPASSQRIGRMLILLAPPDLDAGEITDKGYINQRAVLENRADQVAQLYLDEESAIICR